jgi:serine/threonine protein kinase
LQYGSPGYIAPEVYTQGPSPASDIYSVGVMINAVMTGTRPWWKFPDDEVSYTQIPKCVLLLSSNF